MVFDTAQNAIQGKRWRPGPKKYSVGMTIDFKKAFNSARWSILDSINRMAVLSLQQVLVLGDVQLSAPSPVSIRSKSGRVCR